ncbi:MAG: hypothetical protein K8S99_17250 [Planctomycetes bacterium]|nr:hypothetical protein [Planctomycetota bacterium]
MRLVDIVNELESFDVNATIYAVEPWQSDSLAMVDFEPPAGGLPVAASNRGMTYFLEVSIARDFLVDWARSQRETPSLGERSQRLIRYALNDA